MYKPSVNELSSGSRYGPLAPQPSASNFTVGDRILASNLPINQPPGDRHYTSAMMGSDTPPGHLNGMNTRLTVGMKPRVVMSRRASQRHAGRTLTHLLGVQVNAAIGGVDELGEVADVLRTAQSQRVTAQLFHTQPCVGEDPSCRAHAAEPSRRPRGSPGTCCVEDLCCSARRCRRYRKGVRLLWSRTKCEESQSIHPKLDYSGIVAIVEVLVVPD